MKKLLILSFILLFSCSTTDTTQSEGQKKLIKIAKDWLILAPKKSYLATHPIFQAAVTEKKWVGIKIGHKDKLGLVASRVAHSTDLSMSEGSEIAKVSFTTEFKKAGKIREMVVLQKDAKGAWRTVGYWLP